MMTSTKNYDYGHTRQQQQQQQRQQQQQQRRSETVQGGTSITRACTMTPRQRFSGGAGSSFRTFFWLLVLHCCWCCTCIVSAYHMGESVHTMIRTSFPPFRSEPLRAQTPSFGQDTTVVFQRPRSIPSKSKQSLQHHSFSLEFEDGLWFLPAVETTKASYSKPQQTTTEDEEEEEDENALVSWKVIFVYSRSSGSDGYIHSVRSGDVQYELKPPAAAADFQSMTRKEQNKAIRSPGGEFKVDFVWIQEEPVNVQAGKSIMFFLTLLVCVFTLFSVCVTAAVDEEWNGSSNSSSNNKNRGNSGVAMRALTIASSSANVPKYD